jgi:hypothetical protein
MLYTVRYFDDTYPSFMVNRVDDAIQLIGGLLGCNWATSLQPVAYNDGSVGVKAIKTDTLLGWTIIPN